MTDAGKELLLNQLIGVQTLSTMVPTWVVDIGNQQICLSAGGPGHCGFETQIQYDKPGKKLVLSGTIKALSSGQISSVATYIINQVPQRKPGLQFSSRDLTQPDSQSAQAPPAINVQAGQNVDITVNISIS